MRVLGYVGNFLGVVGKGRGVKEIIQLVSYMKYIQEVIEYISIAY